jgi:hypothetical protein
MISTSRYQELRFEAATMGDLRLSTHDSRNRPATPENIEGHGLAVDYNSDNPNSPTFSPYATYYPQFDMADPIDSAL